MPKKPTTKPEVKKPQKKEKGVKKNDTVEENILPFPGDEIKYPDFEVRIMSSITEDGPITADMAMELLGWHDEATNIAQGMEANPDADEDEFKFKEPLLIDEYDVPVICFNNTKNRPLKISGARAYAQDTLKRKWAGPINQEYFTKDLLEGEDSVITLNGEAIVIGRYGQVLSGQHRLIGLVLAKQMWEKNKEQYEGVWDTEPVLESVLILGVSENRKVLQTLDNCIPRSLSDTIFTSGIYQHKKPAEKKELSRYLANAIDLLWTRVGINNSNLGRKKVYKTNSEENEFLDRHSKLLYCVDHIFECNRKRVISGIFRLSAGHCAALMYLMAASTTDGDDYRDGETTEWSEQRVNFDNYEKAEEFWKLVTSNNEYGTVPLANALALIAEVGEEGARNSEKFVVVARAWMEFLKGNDLESDNIKLQEQDYIKDKNGRLVLDQEAWTDFGGIDYGDPIMYGIKPYEEENEEEDSKSIKQKKREEIERRAKTTLSNTNGTAKDQAESAKEDLQKLRDVHGDKILMFSMGKEYVVYDKDADIFEEVLKSKSKQRVGLKSCSVKQTALKTVVDKLTEAGYKFHIIEE